MSLVTPEQRPSVVDGEVLAGTIVDLRRSLMAPSPTARCVSDADLDEVRQAAAEVRRAIRRRDRISARIIDDYEIEPGEGLDLDTGEIVPAPPQGTDQAR